MLNTASLPTLPQSTSELYAQMLFVALQRLGLDAHAYLDDPERARAASQALSVLWLAIELAASDEPAQLREARFDRSRDLPSLTQLRPLAKGLEEAAREQLSALNASGLLDVEPEAWQRLVPARGTDVMSTLALAWLAEAAVLGDELVVWLSNGAVLRRVIDALAFLLEETLQAGPALAAAHVPLSQSVVGEDERNALIDVWRAENNPAIASGIVLKAADRPAAGAPARKPLPADAGWSGPSLLLFAAVSVAVMLLVLLVVWLAF
jgi:hypothetical protein